MFIADVVSFILGSRQFGVKHIIYDDNK